MILAYRQRTKIIESSMYSFVCPKRTAIYGEASDHTITFALGKQIGKSSGMFSGFMDEYRKALRDEDDDKQ